MNARPSPLAHSDYVIAAAIVLCLTVKACGLEQVIAYWWALASLAYVLAAARAVHVVGSARGGVDFITVITGVAALWLIWLVEQIACAAVVTAGSAPHDLVWPSAGVMLVWGVIPAVLLIAGGARACHRVSAW